VEEENTIRGEGDGFITRYDLKNFVKVASASAHGQFGEFNSSAKGFKPPGTHMVREACRDNDTVTTGGILRIPRSARGPVKSCTGFTYSLRNWCAKGRMTDKNDYAVQICVQERKKTRGKMKSNVLCGR
jgi:hypothetical protein